MIQKFFAGLFASLILSAGIASADTFTFSYSSIADNSVAALGTMTATNNNDGTYSITGVTGTRNGLNITFVTSPPGDIQVDNVLVIPPNPGFLDQSAYSGFVIQTTDGIFNPWYGNGSYGSTVGHYYEYMSGGNTPGPEITFSAQQVPDGGMTLMLLGGALAGLETLRRRFRV
jgi:alkylation response protein AidB-like acyl-CoA dehydrogenase